MIVEEYVRDAIWSRLLEDYELDIIDELVSSWINFNIDEKTEDEIEEYVRECIKRKVTEKAFLSQLDECIDDHIEDSYECFEYLDNCDFDNCVNIYLKGCGCDNFDLIACTKFILKMNIDYSYEDVIADIVMGFFEMKEAEVMEDRRLVLKRVLEL